MWGEGKKNANPKRAWKQEALNSPRHLAISGVESRVLRDFIRARPPGNGRLFVFGAFRWGAFGEAKGGTKGERKEKEKAVRIAHRFREKSKPLKELLLLFLLRIAFLASFLVLGGFNAALVRAFFASLFRVIAATGLDICRADNKRESANN